MAHFGNNLLDACAWAGENQPACHPGRLWSLWDLMNRFHLDRVVRSLFYLELWICRCKHKDHRVQTQYEKLLKHVLNAADACRDAGFTEATRQMMMLYARLNVDVPRDNHDAVAHMLRTVQQQLELAGKDHHLLVLSPQHVADFERPLNRFGIAVAKFPTANVPMVAASRCVALEEWDAAVFHAMRVLEHGLRWLAGVINAGPFPLTLKRPIELECWENIIGNIKGRIDEELGPPPPGSAPRAPKTPERDEELSFYASVAAEFRYFKDAWRNHVMHDRHDPYEETEAILVVEHVASFMRRLAVRA